jgi:hypothetical protein
MRILLIVSAGRSGSRLLRDLLGASPECAVVPYDINFVWRHGHEGARDDALPAAAATPETIRYIRRCIARLAGLREHGDGRLVVEKSVSNSLRVPYVRQVFPEALFVHLIRDGRAAVESARRVWNEPPGSGYLRDKIRYLPWRNYRYAFWYLRNRLRRWRGAPVIWGPRYPGIESDLARRTLLEVCARQWSACVESALTGFAELPDERVFVMRYEDILRDGSRLAELCRFSGIVDPGPVLAAREARVDAARDGKWRTALTPQELDQLATDIGPQLRALGYEA